MPLYEYYCSDCRTKFELLVSHQHADDVVHLAPVMKTLAMKRWGLLWEAAVVAAAVVAAIN